MVRARYLIAGAIILLLLVAGALVFTADAIHSRFGRDKTYASERPTTARPTPAARNETRLAVKDTQDAERLVAAAEDVRDFRSLRLQSGRLSGLLVQIPSDEASAYREPCLLAIDRLGNLARHLTRPYLAQAVVDAATARREYLEHMRECEDELELSPPPRPNLR